MAAIAVVKAKPRTVEGCIALLKFVAGSAMRDMGTLNPEAEVLLEYRLADDTFAVGDNRHRERIALKNAAHHSMSCLVIGRLLLASFRLSRHRLASAAVRPLQLILARHCPFANNRSPRMAADKEINAPSRTAATEFEMSRHERPYIFSEIQVLLRHLHSNM
jgi:hypothetical protein